MSQDRIKSLLHEERSYLPPRHGKDVARIRSRREYDALCELARTDNDSFWAERARALLHWFKPWDKVQDTDFYEPRVRWFIGGG